MLAASATVDVPELLRPGVDRWWERASADADVAAACRALPDALRDQLPGVIAGSEFIAAALLQDPAALSWLSAAQDPDTLRDACAAAEARSAAAPTTAEGQRLLREWRRREMVRIAWNQIAGQAGTVDTLHALSDLAEGCLRAAAAAARRHLQPVFGLPRFADGSEMPLIVIGMGKLGGRELNFSSDIDLIFLFPEPGETDGARRIENEEYFNRLGRELIRLLDARTEDGFAFRVDMRLRPFGESGPLVVSLSSLENYLQHSGRDWERYAWIKARAIVGIEPYLSASPHFVRPFVYRRYLDFGIFESLRDMKALIAREVSRRELGRHVKLGPGGIREAEFIVQSLQLVRGGGDRRLQSTSLLEVLPALAGAKLMMPEDVSALRAAYLTLRRAENALQMIRDEQTHSLPESEADRLRLAVNMGCGGWGDCEAQIEAARGVITRQFGALLFGAGDAPKAESGAAWLASADASAAEELARAGFPAESIAELAGIIDAYRRAAPYRRLDETGMRRLHLIIGRLLDSVAGLASRTGVASPADLAPRTGLASPATVVQRVLRVLEAIGTRSSYLALLKEQPAALDRLIEICAISGFLARQVADFPLLLDELIDPKSLDAPPSREGFAAELAARTERLPTDDPERQVEALRQFQKVAVFSVALADLTGRLPLMKVSDRLTDIAELIVERCVALGWAQMTHVYGVPRCLDGGEGDSGGRRRSRAVRVAVAGYGKLGGLELGYGSDLDLVFLHDSRGERQETDGERPLDNTVFFLRLGQRIVSLLTMHSAAGRLYEVDMRLRPNGKGGFLMTGIDGFVRYQREEAWTWEHQALLRARAVAGDVHLRAEFEQARRAVLSQSVRRATLRDDVRDMRVRMRRELSKAKRGEFDIKQDAGGIADIEFLVQYWVLAHARERPELLTYSDNIRQLEGLAAAGILEGGVAAWLTQAYIGYRTVLHHLSLEADGERVVPAEPHAETRARVGAIWRETFGTED